MPKQIKNNNTNKKRLNTQQSVDQTVKSICDIMRRGNMAGAMQYVPELTWILFLRILDEREEMEEEDARVIGIRFTPSLQAPYRWRDWAAPDSPKRKELETGALGSFFAFVNGTPGNNSDGLISHLKNLKNRPDATPRQKVISEIMSGVERVRIDTERNFRDVLDRVHNISEHNVDKTHVFTLSQVYEGLLLKMGEKGNDGGQFFTPREVIRAMVRVIDPQVGEKVYDPGCGTGGFLAQSFVYINENKKADIIAEQLDSLKTQQFWGREKENMIYPIALANLILHGIDRPNIWHGNTLTGAASYDGLFVGAPHAFDVILTNPPFGGKEGKDAQTSFDYQTSATQVLYLQHVIRNLRNGGRCGIVLDEGLLFRTNEDAFVKTKRKLLDDCNVWCIVSLPAGVFTAAGAGVKTNLVFFSKGKPTENIWYYDLTDVKVRKKTPLTIKHFVDFFKHLPQRAETELSWTVNVIDRKRKAAEEAKPFKETANQKQQQALPVAERIKTLKNLIAKTKRQITANEKDLKSQSDKTEFKELDLKLTQLLANVTDQLNETENNYKSIMAEFREASAKAKEIEDAVYDLKAVNPNKKQTIDTRTPNELIDIIEAKGKEIAEALAELRKISA